MKRLFSVLLILALLGLPAVALASNIDNAEFFAVIHISANRTATTDVAVVASVNTTNLIEGDFLNAEANNCVVKSSSGADVPFQPGYSPSGYPWCLWAESIGDYGIQSQILYTANSTGGLIRYFPGSGGMTTPDDDSLELGDNFTITQAGFVDTTAGGDKNLVNKPDAFTTFILEAQSIRSSMATGTSANETLRPDGVGDNTTITDIFGGQPTHWQTVNDSADGTYLRMLGTTKKQDLYTCAGSSNTSAINSVTIYFRIRNSGAAATTYGEPHFKIDGTLYTGTEQGILGTTWATKNQVYATSPAGGDWTWEVINAMQIGLTMRSSAAGEYGYFSDIWIIVNYNLVLSVTATGVTSDNHTIVTTADTANLTISIDGATSGSLYDSIALGGGKVPRNSENWTAFQNLEDYWEYHKISVNGTLAQHIVWEYGTTFHDLSVNDNDATPTFRTAGSDADVTAELYSFQPVAEAKAPAYVLGEGVDFIDPAGTGNFTGTFTTTPGTGTFPLAGVITALANATETPAQLPLLIIAAFIILAVSLSFSAITRRSGSGSIFVKVIVIASVMGIFIGLENFAIDFWMLAVFVIIGLTFCMGSRQVGFT